ncbi:MULTISPECIES: AI-2E family transporter [Acinetobacter]|uniref:AI-2E family transporter n=1 Tax=Acinetobacter indicus TaxID=756892 RepID=A0A7S6VSR8_9GAMM|nr:AI-2E family transporter [Acinetobacter indicus]MCO8087473.1 AI-2E family transporter [Acinetobacter indicus]MCO8098590.1 AI-2E family transporter [Acinetobacter indicus]MCO8101655.1 AI-2E family transporter [Acinetobacter indicus]MCO8104193.1 AI-2E family transporter [Acinetobacter indicus]MCO8107039.1 AI-2E family transporter [Acinetobacter indicus]
MQQYAPTLQKVLLFGLFFVLIFLSFHVLKYFIVPVVWATIIAYMTWPLYQSVQRMCGPRPTLSATIMMILVTLVVGIPLTFAIFILQHEGRNLYYELQKQVFSGHLNVPDFIRDLPFVGKEISRSLREINEDPNSIINSISVWIQGHLNYGRFLLSEISRNLIKLGFAMLSLFFFYRDGQTILNQVSKALEMVIGPRVHHYLDTISETTRAVVYGVGLTAIAQALLAGVSYFVAGVPNPMVLTIVTFLFALIPFGPPLAYGSVALWLFSQGQTIEAIGVMAWGVCVVSTADNVIRPLVISGATQIPFLLIMFGVLGGIASFGLIGLFIGPVILAVLLAIWREWLHETNEAEAMMMPKTTMAYDLPDDQGPTAPKG